MAGITKINKTQLNKDHFLFSDDLFTEIRKSSPSVVNQYNNFNVIYNRNIIKEQSNVMLLKDNRVKNNTKKSRSRGIVPSKNSFKKLIEKLISSCNDELSSQYIMQRITEPIEKALYTGTEMEEVPDKKYDILYITRKKQGKKKGEIHRGNIIGDEDVMGFIITNAGECSIYNNVPVLNIICAKKTRKSEPSIGRYLLYIYLRALLNKNINMGLLEVAGNYDNVSAYCLYNKFGFREDASLDRNDCFSSSAMGKTLAMKADLSQKTFSVKNLDIALLTGIPIPLPGEEEPMCQASVKNNPEKQQRYIKIREENRKYITQLMNQGTDQLENVLDTLNIDKDILYGDGTTDIDYVKKELIKTGCEFASEGVYLKYYIENINSSSSSSSMSSMSSSSMSSMSSMSSSSSSSRRSKVKRKNPKKRNRGSSNSRNSRNRKTRKNKKVS